MGVDPLTIGLGLTAAGSIFGAHNQGKANKANTAAQQAALAQQAARQQQVTGYVEKFLQQGQNPFAAQLMQMFGGGAGGFQMPGGVTAQDINPAGFFGQSFNTGQDSMMQLMRAAPEMQREAGLENLQQIAGGGTQYNMSDLFGSLNKQAMQGLDEQLLGLRGSAGSLGQRLGSTMGRNEARLRENFLTNLNAQNQQIGFGAFEAAQGRRLGATGQLLGREQATNQFNLGRYGHQAGLAQALASLGLGQAGLLAQIAQGNQSTNLQSQLANQGNQQAWNQFRLGGISQAGAFQQAQQGQNINLIALLAGLQPGQIPTAQPSPWAGAMGDIGQLLMFLPFLKGLGGGGGSTGWRPRGVPPANIPTSLF